MKPCSLLVCVMVACFAGCVGAHRDHGVPPDGGNPVCGAVTCDETPAPTCANDTTLRTYTAGCTDNACSYPSTDTDCGAGGCCGDHCCEIAPSNGSEFGTLEPTGLIVTAPNGTFDTDSECVAVSALGNCSVVARTGLPEACVCRADEITIHRLEIRGARALVLFATTKVTISQLLDVSGAPARGGPGSLSVYAPVAGSYEGGVGGSFATIGGATWRATVPAATYGAPALVPLLGGAHGESAGNAGGGGGGALQITAGERIEIAGVINAGGGGGRAGYSASPLAGGGGGGAGGAILLEAPTVIVTGSLVANGGGGGGAGGETRGGNDGSDAGQVINTGPNPDPMATAYGGNGDSGGGCALNGYTSGGWGGRGATGTEAAYTGGPSDAVAGCFNYAYVGGGGGGGGVGRVRINTTTGCHCSGQIAPQATFGTLGNQ